LYARLSKIFNFSKPFSAAYPSLQEVSGWGARGEVQGRFHGQPVFARVVQRTPVPRPGFFLELFLAFA
jgi:hypothetical protein